jgi:hypothetical protein
MSNVSDYWSNSVNPSGPWTGGKTSCQGWAYDVLTTSGMRLVPAAAECAATAISRAHSGVIARLSGRRWMVGRALGTAWGWHIDVQNP